MVSATQIQLTTDQLYAIGFGDGLASRVQDRKYSDSLDYVMGHVQGYRTNPDSLFNQPKTEEAPLERGWGDELLNPLNGRAPMI